MSKPMIVTLPALLLLVDWWPLKRKFTRMLLWEKVPFALFALGDAVATYLVQRSVGAVTTLDEYSALLRIENGLTTVAVYVLKMFVPVGLGVLYAFPASIPPWRPILIGGAICAVTVLVLRFRRYPWLAMGWFWYLITLIPIIGIVQVGQQARADRYTYVPLVGVSIMTAWGAAAIVERWPSVRPFAISSGVAVAVVLAVATWRQIPYWYNSVALFERAVDVEPQNYVAWDYLAADLAVKPASVAKAISDYETAIRIRPDFDEAHNGLGVTLFNMGLVPLAMAEYRKAIRINPYFAEAHYDLGSALLSLGQESEAIREFETAVRINASFAAAYNDLGAALLKVPDRRQEGIADLQKALKINPEYSVAHNNLGLALSKDPRQLGAAIEHFQKAIKIQPRYADAWFNLGMALLQSPGHVDEAIATLEGSLRLRPDGQLRAQLDRIEAAERERIR
jgi:Flp pilus assembly protein TadD